VDLVRNRDGFGYRGLVKLAGFFKETMKTGNFSGLDSRLSEVGNGRFSGQGVGE